ncbi:PKD domain-containing protein [Nocardia acidivorans]|uniref:PKD domain-containing protein n=1 Tax=Nocardia acidivorans TaxID=404580 RepID=UPI000B1282C5|nr:PKD domain-containing protein [Nocardia acidivorans]
MKLWRSRWCRVALLPTLVGATAVAGPLARADIGTELPLIIDVSTPAAGQCDGALHGTTAVYFPPGVPAHADVEWRILGGGQPIRTGITPVNSDVMTVGFDIRQDELPADGRLRVDARARVPGGAVGGYGKPWNLRVSRECRPLHVVSAGDSVTWGQGLGLDRTFADLTAEALGTQTGRTARLHDYSVSGAALDAPVLHADTEDAGCPVDAKTTDETRTDRLPDVFCQLEQAGAEARAGGYPVDLVLLDGCINDLDPLFGIPVGVTPGTKDVTAAVQRECAGVGAEADNPAVHVPYFSGAKLGYGGRGMRAAIEKAHNLPGSPKVLVSNYFHGEDAPGAPEALRARWSEFIRVSAETFRQAAQQANSAAGEVYAVAADGLVSRDGGDHGPWMNPLGDEEVSLRLLACPHIEAPPQCRTAAVSHTDVDGAREYAKTFLLNPVVREWFGGGGPLGDGFTVSKTSGPAGTTVEFDGAPAGGAIRQYDWYFGDGAHASTDGPTIAHAYRDPGPNLPRLVVTDMTGRRAMYELEEPIVIG